MSVLFSCAMRPQTLSGALGIHACILRPLPTLHRDIGANGHASSSSEIFILCLGIILYYPHI